MVWSDNLSARRAAAQDLRQRVISNGIWCGCKLHFIRSLVRQFVVVGVPQMAGKGGGRHPIVIAGRRGCDSELGSYLSGAL